MPTDDTRPDTAEPVQSEAQSAPPSESQSPQAPSETTGGGAAAEQPEATAERSERADDKAISSAVKAATDALREEAIRWRRKHSKSKKALDALEAERDALLSKLRDDRLDREMRQTCVSLGVTDPVKQSRLMRAVSGEYSVDWSDDHKPTGTWSDALKAAASDLGLLEEKDEGKGRKAKNGSDTIANLVVHAPYVAARPRNDAANDAPTGVNADILRELSR